MEFGVTQSKFYQFNKISSACDQFDTKLYSEICGVGGNVRKHRVNQGLLELIQSKGSIYGKWEISMHLYIQAQQHVEELRLVRKHY